MANKVIIIVYRELVHHFQYMKLCIGWLRNFNYLYVLCSYNSKGTGNTMDTNLL